MGINSGDVIILEGHGSQIVLKPGIALEIDHYSDEQIAQWDIEDKLSEDERHELAKFTTILVKNYGVSNV